MRSHTGVRPFVCSYCSKSFMRLNTLNVHVKKHLSAKPFDCPVDGCRKNYTEKGNLVKHIKTSHKDFQVVSKVGSNEVNVVSSSSFSNKVERTAGPTFQPQANKEMDGLLPCDTYLRQILLTLQDYCGCESFQNIIIPRRPSTKNGLSYHL